MSKIVVTNIWFQVLLTSSSSAFSIFYKKMSLPGLSSDASEDMFMFLDLQTLMMGLSLVNKSLHDKIMNASERLWLFRLDHIESLAKTKARKGRVFRNECFRSIDNNQLKNETKSFILFRIFRKHGFRNYSK